MTPQMIVNTLAIQKSEDVVMSVLMDADIPFTKVDGRVKVIRDWKYLPFDVKEIWVLVDITDWEHHDALLVHCMIDREANFNIVSMYRKKERVWTAEMGMTDGINKVLKED